VIMRLRSLAVPAAAFLAAAVGLPGPAAAAAQCSLVMPTKVKVDQPTEVVVLRPSSNCEASGAHHAVWHVTAPSGEEYRAITVTAEDLAPGGTPYYEFFYGSGDHGTWTAVPQGASTVDSTPLTQNTPSTAVKYGGRIMASATRTSTSITWKATATSWSPTLDEQYPRAGASLSLWYLPPGSSTWQWVKAVKTSSTGKATVSVAPKAGQYRLGIAETSTVWADYSSSTPGLR
jgi:hypothetical protein